MRILVLLIIIFSFTVSKAQTVLPGSYLDYVHNGAFGHNNHLLGNSSKKKWSLSKYSGISTSFSFFKGGNATIFSAPLGLQLNRKLNNNLYAFAGVSVAPAYINFNSSFRSAGFNKLNQTPLFFNAHSLGIYSRAELGLQYVNDEKTFSISGSIGIEKSSSPMFPYYQMNNSAQRQVIPGNR
jgi:hypothetical protein